jgi:hypothetical protein
MKSKPPLEKHLQQTVLAYLKKLHSQDPSLVFRKRLGSPLGVAGDPDLTGLWRGVHFEVEFKILGQSPTRLQQARLAEWRAAGAHTAVIHSLPELQLFLQTVAPLQNTVLLDPARLPT